MDGVAHSFEAIEIQRRSSKGNYALLPASSLACKRTAELIFFRAECRAWSKECLSAERFKEEQISMHVNPFMFECITGACSVYAFGRGNNIPRCHGLSVPRHVALVYSGVKKERRKLCGKKQYRVLSTKQEHKLRFVQWHNFFILSWRANEQELSQLFVGLVLEGVKVSVFVPMVLGSKKAMIESFSYEQA
jgi:hypothetical protein